jgi:hypothetical protein
MSVLERPRGLANKGVGVTLPFELFPLVPVDCGAIFEV